MNPKMYLINVSDLTIFFTNVFKNKQTLITSNILYCFRCVKYKKLIIPKILNTLNKNNKNLPFIFPIFHSRNQQLAAKTYFN